MGGCCCCFSKETEPSRAPAHYYCPRVSEEHEPLSPHGVASSALSTGLLVNTNLETSILDTYRSPPTPLPYDSDLGRPQTPTDTPQSRGNKTDAAVQTENSDSVEAPVSGITLESLVKLEDLKDAESKGQTDIEVVSKEHEIEISKPVDSIVLVTEEEDCCPTCLEEYDAENPKIITKCEHHFHLACILEWMERSDTCPVCDQEMIFNPVVNG